MPDIGVLHPQIVHFVVAFLLLGVALRWIALSGRLSWTGPAAVTLLLAGTVAAVLAVKSGDDAHGPAERIPGARDLVKHHEELGERTRNIFLLVAALELGALGLGTRKPARLLRVASALAGVVGAYYLYETAEHGGEVVYEYAGGVGTRSGNPEDVERLLLAAIYHQSQADRRTLDAEGAARLVEEAARRFPGNLEVQLLAAESRLRDREDPHAALSQLDALEVPADDPRLQARAGLLRADALEAAGLRDEAVAVLEGLTAALPENSRVASRLQELRTASRPAAPDTGTTLRP